MRLILYSMIVDVIANPDGPAFLNRDAYNVATWFSSKGVTEADGDELAALLRAEARLR